MVYIDVVVTFHYWVWPRHHNSHHALDGTVNYNMHAWAQPYGNVAVGAVPLKILTQCPHPNSTYSVTTIIHPLGFYVLHAFVYHLLHLNEGQEVSDPFASSILKAWRNWGITAGVVAILTTRGFPDAY